MKGTWSLLNNTFEINTRKSMVKMLRIATDHLSKISANAAEDPVFRLMVNRFKQPLEDFTDELSGHSMHEGSRKGQTQSVTGLMRELSKDWVRVWEGKVHYFYPSGSADALAIFPLKRAAFQRGSYEKIIQRVKTLHETLKNYPLLAGLQQDVLEKYELLLAARQQQTGQKAAVGLYSNLLEKQRIRLAVLMLRNMGLLLDKYGETPSSVERFFDMKLLRRKMPDKGFLFKYNSQAGAGATVIVPLPASLALSGSSYCKLVNASGGQAMEFYFTTGDPESPNPVKMPVPAGKTVEINASECGWEPGKKFLAVKNTGGLAAAFSLLLMKEWS